MLSEIQDWLFRHQDQKYANFQRRLIPSVSPDAIIGVRTPELRKYAKELVQTDNIADFLSTLPHDYFEENQLHAFILASYKQFDLLLPELESFLPYIDNWATCDTFSPKIFKKHREDLLAYISKWLSSTHAYTVRFGIGMLMEHYLEDAFNLQYPDMVAAVRSKEYYINMMIAWYFATALAKQYDAILPYLENNRLARWTHNKTIQKALESYRIAPEQKVYLKTLKIPKA